MRENYVGFNTQFGINTRSCLKEVNPDKKYLATRNVSFAQNVILTKNHNVRILGTQE